MTGLDNPSSFTPLNPSGDHPEEEERHYDYTVPQKVHK